jgi:AcrR family transcriptional regulator
VTIEFLRERPEAELRVADICEQAEMSSTVVYSYFGSREGLIDEAYLAIYIHEFKILTEMSMTLIDLDLNPPIVLSDLVDSSFVGLFDKLEGSRELRLRVYARCINNSVFAKKIANIREAQLNELVKMVSTEYPSRKIFVTDFALRAAASIFETLQTSRSIYELIFPVEIETNFAQLALFGLNGADSRFR